MSEKKKKKRRNDAAGEPEEERTPESAGERPEEEARASEAVEDAEHWRERYLRALAELDNYRKRMEREREQGRRYAEEQVVRALLPALDHLQMAADAEGDAESIRAGVRLALEDMLRALHERGMEPIEALDEPFDPRFHEAMATIPDPERKPGTVVAELQRGYTFHDRVLRPSRVHVAAAPPEEEPDAPEDRTEET